ncbi:MAG: AMP-binding protein [Thiobacillaceae bacterium]|nr:AMP-binding protein [Thiobacillaceae bacterium]
MEIDRQGCNDEVPGRTVDSPVSEHFNIAVDVCGRWAEDRSRFALYYEDEEGVTSAHTFWDIQRAANRLSNVLAALGTLPGDRVAILLPQCPEAAIAQIAIYQMGAVAVPLSQRLGPDALAYRLGDSGTHLAIVDQATQARLLPLRQQLPELRHLLGVGGAAGEGVRRWAEVLAHASPRYSPATTAASDPAMTLYGNRTTGMPKCTLMAHRALLGRLDGYVCSHDGFPQPRDLFWSPADWASPDGLWNVLLPTWHFGMPLLAYKGRFDAGKAFSLIEKYGVRNSFLPSTTLRKMMAAVPEPRATYDLDMRTLVSAGPIGQAVLEWAREKLGLPIHKMCG